MMDPGYRGTNITLTVQRRIGDSLTVGSETVKVLYGRFADPDATRTPGTNPLKSYVIVTWGDQSAGQKGSHVCYLDVFTLIGPETAGGDPQGLRCSRIADAIMEIFRAPSNDRFSVYDFADVTAPLRTGICLYTVGPNSARGFPLRREVIPWEDGLNRIRITYQFKTVVDRSFSGGYDP